MKASFVLPSHNYNIVLSKEDVKKLLKTGHITIDPLRDMPCTTSRAIWDGSSFSAMRSIDKHDIPNNLRFYLEGDVGGLSGGDCHVQFLTINLEEPYGENR